jgi:tetratricopeptide (TPR) repeat protein
LYFENQEESLAKRIKTVSKKQKLREDKFLISVTKGYNYIQENWKLCVIAGVSLIVFIVAVTGFTYRTRTRNLNSELMFFNLNHTYKMEKYSEAISGYKELIDEYGSTSAGKRGVYYLADCYFRTQDYENAVKFFKKFLDSGFKSDILVPAARQGIAATYEQKEDYKLAAEEYEKLGEDFRDSFLGADGLMGAARCYEKLENYQKSAENYKKVIERYDKTEFKFRAQSALNLISAFIS